MSVSVDKISEEETNMQFPEYVTNRRLRTWVQEVVELCKPDSVHWCDGSQQE